MTDLLDQIDASLGEVEEQLLDEYTRIRNTVSADRVSPIDVGIKNALIDVVEDLHNRLEHSGDVYNLQLLSERHEILYARIAVLGQLLKASVPTACLLEANEGVQARRRTLELRVIQQRGTSARHGEAGKPGLASGIRALFSHKPTSQAIARNRIQVTELEEQALAHTQIYLDNGVYSASRELAMVASVMRGGTLDRPPEVKGNEPPHGKANFESRELSNTIAPRTNVKPVAPEPVPEPRTGKATFLARDIEPEFKSEPPRRREPPKPSAPKEEPPRTGKAVFSSRDIEPVAPSDPPRKRERPNPPPAPKPEAAPKPVSGPAVFESRDLSSDPFPKRD